MTCVQSRAPMQTNREFSATNLLGHDDARTTQTYLRNRKAKVVAGPKLATS